jgi:TadE-like protein
MLAGTRSSHRCEQRLGVTLVEFAVVIPLALLCVLLTVALYGLLAPQNTVIAVARQAGCVASPPRVVFHDEAVDIVKTYAGIASALKNDFPTVPSKEGLIYIHLYGHLLRQ